MTTSKETPASAIAKTASAPNPSQKPLRSAGREGFRAGAKKQFQALAFVALFLVVLVGFVVLHRPPAPHVVLRIGARNLQLEETPTSAARQKGLGGRASLPADHGMLFVFESGEATCFWMKGMRFSLDMIWLDSHKQITTITANIAPNTYPQTFCPSAKSTYVIELNAGQAKALGLATGQILRF